MYLWLVLVMLVFLHFPQRLPSFHIIDLNYCVLVFSVGNYFIKSIRLMPSRYDFSGAVCHWFKMLKYGTISSDQSPLVNVKF